MFNHLLSLSWNLTLQLAWSSYVRLALNIILYRRWLKIKIFLIGNVIAFLNSERDFLSLILGLLRSTCLLLLIIKLLKFQNILLHIDVQALKEEVSCCQTNWVMLSHL